MEVALSDIIGKVTKFKADFTEVALHLDETVYLCLPTLISGRRWLLTHGLACYY